MTTETDPIGDLVAAVGTDPATLDEIRAAVDAALAGGQQCALHGGVGGGAVAAAGVSPPARRVQVEGAANPFSLVLRQDLPLQPATGPGAMPAWAIGRAANAIGGLRGALGQSVTVNIFPPVVGTSLCRASQTAPLMVVAGTTLEWTRSGRGQIGAGSVWLPAHQFEPTVATGSWCGLTISGGTITGSGVTVGPSGVLVVPDAAVLTVTLELAPPVAAAGSGPGGDARTADVRLPTQATFVLAPGGASVSSVAPALLTAYGSTVRFGELGAGVRYVAALGSLLVPMAATPVAWPVASHLSVLVALGGGGPVGQTGWALPVTVADASTLGAAAGVGALGLQVDGLTLAVLGQPRVPLGTAWLTALPGLLTVAPPTRGHRRSRTRRWPPRESPFR